MEEEIQASEIEQGEAGSNGEEAGSNIGEAGNNNEEPGVEMSSNSPPKRGRGRPQGSKKLRVCVSDVNLTDMVQDISNGGSSLPKRGRGRPKLSKTQESGGGDAVNTNKSPGRPKGSKNKTPQDRHVTEASPKKRGRPQKSITPESDTEQDLPNGGSEVPKARRGRPKGSGKRKLESSTSGEENEGSTVPRKRGRPKGSPNKQSKLDRLLGVDANRILNSLNHGRSQRKKAKVDYISALIEETSNGTLKKVHRGRGRPRKIQQQSSDQVSKRGRPKGSLNKRVHGRVGRPPKVQLLPPSAKKKRGRPRKVPLKRGRPRKNPLLSSEDLNKPKVWKPLGRPRKYPRVDPPEGALTGPRRSRGRPRKSDSKKAAHLRKKTSPRPSVDGSPRKRGRPPGSTKKEAESQKKRGRPKGSVNKNKGKINERQESELELEANKSKGDLPEEEEERGGGETGMEVVPSELEEEAAETLIDQDASNEVSTQD